MLHGLVKVDLHIGGGKDITHISPRDRGIGMVFQQYSLFPNMSVAQNVAFGLNMKKVPKDTIRPWAR